MCRLIAPFVFEGYSNTAIYETYVERILAPALKPGMFVVIDNASFHKSIRVKELIEERGCKIIFLPPYSPDFNPIEHHWAAIKSEIRKVAQTIQNFFKATIQVLAETCKA